MTFRFLRLTSWRILFKFVFTFCLKGVIAVEKFKSRIRKGIFSPAFVFISITERCNLDCTGCWVTKKSKRPDMSPELLDKIISDFKKQGSRFFGILGGEPLYYPALFEVIEKHPDCYFQILTNGTLITEEAGTIMRRLGNVTPLLSIEGLEKVADERRGGSEVASKSFKGLETCVRNKLVTGVASSICKSNFDSLVNEDFLDSLISAGVLYVWFYIYRPAGSSPGRELALDHDQIRSLRKFCVEQRVRRPIMIIDSCWDGDGASLCPAAAGISHHVNCEGYVEPCPVVQYARDRLDVKNDSVRIVSESVFLGRFRSFAAGQGRGCIFLENPAALKNFVLKEGAIPTSGRENQNGELDFSPLPGHDMKGSEIPEKSFIYKFAKKRWFFGFGAYG